jgi:hypothetical protein
MPGLSVMALSEKLCSRKRAASYSTVLILLVSGPVGLAETVSGGLSHDAR